MTTYNFFFPLLAELGVLSLPKLDSLGLTGGWDDITFTDTPGRVLYEPHGLIAGVWMAWFDWSRLGSMGLAC